MISPICISLKINKYFKLTIFETTLLNYFINYKSHINSYIITKFNFKSNFELKFLLYFFLFLVKIEEILRSCNSKYDKNMQKKYSKILGHH